jgi:hypothetical protein
MQFRRAFEWVSEFCGVCLGCGLMWCHVRISLLEDKIHWMERIKATQLDQQPVVLIEGEFERILKKVQEDRNEKNVNGSNDSAESADISEHQ